jgi:hypothetical protein
MCVYSSLSCGKVEYMHIAPLRRVHVWNRFSDRIILFQIEIKFSNFKIRFEISKFDLRFQINSNGFSRDRSFGHEFSKTRLKCKSYGTLLIIAQKTL